MDAQIFWDPLGTCSCWNGVTSVVMGNCGFTIAPCKERDRDLVMKNLTQVEGMSLDALRDGIDWSFETFPEYVRMLADKGVVPNIACFLGHSSIRTYVMGAAATERAATPEEIDQMCAIVEQGMVAGAVGFACGFAPDARKRIKDNARKRAFVILGEIKASFNCVTQFAHITWP